MTKKSGSRFWSLPPKQGQSTRAVSSAPLTSLNGMSALIWTPLCKCNAFCHRYGQLLRMSEMHDRICTTKSIFVKFRVTVCKYGLNFRKTISKDRDRFIAFSWSTAEGLCDDWSSGKWHICHSLQSIQKGLHLCWIHSLKPLVKKLQASDNACIVFIRTG